MKEIYICFKTKTMVDIFEADKYNLYLYKFYNSITEALSSHNTARDHDTCIIHCKTDKLCNTLLVRSDIEVIKIYDIEGVNKLKALI